MMHKPLLLASASPRRKELLGYAGIPFEVIRMEVDEECDGSGGDRVAMLAERKARAAADLYPDRMILAADTLVQVDGEVLGKPADEQDARRMLRLLSGRWHQVFTGVCLADGRDHTFTTRVAETQVLFSKLEDAVIDGYIRSGEPMDKAGAYAVQGRAGLFVESLQGSYSNVIGLPLALVREMLETAGISIFEE